MRPDRETADAATPGAGRPRRAAAGLALALAFGQAALGEAGDGEQPHLAAGAPAAQSSTFEEASADRAVDGDPDGDHLRGSVALTHRDPFPFWWVDLGSPTAVGTVVVHGRTDAHPERLEGFILVGLPDGPSPATEPLLSTLERQTLADAAFERPGWKIHRSAESFDADHASETIAMEGELRYLYLLLPRADYLQLAEVEVWPPEQ